MFSLPPSSILGSVPQLAYDYLIDAGGYAEEWSFPYISYQGTTNGTCNELNDLNPIKAGITGYTTLDANNATQVMNALANVGPLAINVDASIWHNYESGVWDGCSYGIYHSSITCHMFSRQHQQFI